MECFWCQKVALFSKKDTVNLCLNSPSKKKAKKHRDNDFRSEKVANKSEKVTFFAKKNAFISFVIAPPTKKCKKLKTMVITILYPKK